MSDKDFETWWGREGSVGPSSKDDLESHAKKMCEIAWSNGRYKMSPQQKIKAAVEVCGVEAVWNKLNGFCNFRGILSGADQFVIEADGSVYDEENGVYLTDQELSEFLEWAEGEYR